MKPLFKYPGGKTRELKNIRFFYPANNENTIYIEPFLGGGAVYWDFPDAKEYHINDISLDLINIYKFSAVKEKIFMDTLKMIGNDWEVLNSNKDKTIIKIDNDKYEWFLQRKKGKMEIEDAIITARKSSYFVGIRNLYNKETNLKKKSAYYLFIMSFAFSSLFQYNSKGEINIPYGGKGYNSKSFNKVIEKIVSNDVQARLSKTKFYSEDFDVFLKRFYKDNNAFVFIDPPYVSDMIYNGVKFDFNQQEKLVNSTGKLKNFLTVIGDEEKIFEIYSKKNFKIIKKPIKFSINFKGRNEKDKFNLYISNK